MYQARDDRRANVRFLSRRRFGGALFVPSKRRRLVDLIDQAASPLTILGCAVWLIVCRTSNFLRPLGNQSRKFPSCTLDTIAFDSLYFHWSSTNRRIVEIRWLPEYASLMPRPALNNRIGNGERGWVSIRAIGDSLRHRHALYHAHAQQHSHGQLVHAWHHQQLNGVNPLSTAPL